MSSSGSASRSARTTVRPPSPESNTPSGASSFTPSRHRGLARLDRLLGQELEDGHPHRDARLDLIEDDAARPVGEARVELDAAVDRPRVHDDGVGLGEREQTRR